MFSREYFIIFILKRNKVYLNLLISQLFMENVSSSRVSIKIITLFYMKLMNFLLLHKKTLINNLVSKLHVIEKSIFL